MQYDSHIESDTQTEPKVRTVNCNTYVKGEVSNKKDQVLNKIDNPDNDQMFCSMSVCS